MSDKCPKCRAPIDYTETGEMRFDSSRYHMDAVKRLSEISAMNGYIDELETALNTISTMPLKNNSWKITMYRAVSIARAVLPDKEGK